VSKMRFFLAMGQNGPYSETSFVKEAKFFRIIATQSLASQERCGR
jgi:hypothetical protein